MHEVIEKTPGKSYYLPLHTVTENGLEQIGTKKEGYPDMVPIFFVKGAKDDENIPKQDGVTTEQLLATARMFLEAVNTGDLSNAYTLNAIEYIQEAEKMLQARAADRANRGVQGTYKK